MMHFQYPFYAILASFVFSQTLVQSADGNIDAIYTEMNEKLHRLHEHDFKKLAKRIVEKDRWDTVIKYYVAQREKNISDQTSRNAVTSEMLETWRIGGIAILDDYLTLKQKIHPSLKEKMAKKWEQLERPLNVYDDYDYSTHQVERMITKKEEMHSSLLNVLEIIQAENAAFFQRLGVKFHHYLCENDEEKKIIYTFTGLYDYVYLMAGMKLLREYLVDSAQQPNGAHTNLHHDHSAADVPAKDKSIDHDKRINIRALKWIVDGMYKKLNGAHYMRMLNASAHHPDDQYPSIEQRNQILEEAKSLLEASEKIQYKYTFADGKPTAEAESRFESELDKMMHVKRLEPMQLLEYFAELVFNEWAKKTKMGTTKSETNDENKFMTEVDKAMEEKKIDEGTASSNTGDLKSNAKGKRKVKE